MEARNFITAREMLTHNNWIFTTMNELPRYEKPPLPTWLTAISAWLFGIQNLFAYRLPAALSALMLFLIFYKLQAYQFYLLWTLITVVLLSIIPEKKSRYLLPAIIPLAVTTAFYVEYVIKNFKLKLTKLEKFPIYLNFFLLTLIALAIPFIFYYVLGEALWEMRTLFILF